MKKTLTILLFFSLNIFIKPQVNQKWASVFNGTGNGTDNASAMVIDNSGNIYVTGESNTSDGSNDLIIIKYNSDGDTLWVRYYNGAANSRDVGRDITVDSDDNVYVTGESRETTDTDVITLKYNSSGERQWAAIYNGAANGPDGGLAIAVDNSGNVCVTGFSDGDPNTVFRQDDILTIKYSSGGTEIWAEQYNGTSTANDIGQDIAVDTSGNIYVTGQSASTGAQYDYATLKYSPGGNLIWDRLYNGPANFEDIAYSIAVDEMGNVFVTGQSAGSNNDDADYATIKYNSAGNQQWVARYNGMGGPDEGENLFLKGNYLYVTGGSRNPAAPNSYDFLTIKYDTAAGDTVWTARYNSDDSMDDFGLAVTADDMDNVYVTGYIQTTGNGYDFTTIKYNPSGEESWVKSYNGSGSGNDFAFSIAVDTAGSVYIAGTSFGSGTANDIVTIKYTEGPTSVSSPENIPELFSLLQNYPNPFNPATVISFYINQYSFVSLKVYDILGNEIENLINEYKAPGNYQLTFSGENISSGVYYYKLQAGSYSQVKKMVLIK